MRFRPFYLGIYGGQMHRSLAYSICRDVLDSVINPPKSNTPISNVPKAKVELPQLLVEEYCPSLHHFMGDDYSKSEEKYWYILIQDEYGKVKDIIPESLLHGDKTTLRFKLCRMWSDLLQNRSEAYLLNLKKDSAEDSVGEESMGDFDIVMKLAKEALETCSEITIKYNGIKIWMRK
jgi:hypothetical protein